MFFTCANNSGFSTKLSPYEGIISLIFVSHSPIFSGKHVLITSIIAVTAVDAEDNLILVKGAVPGPKKALVEVREAVKA